MPSHCTGQTESAIILTRSSLDFEDSGLKI